MNKTAVETEYPEMSVRLVLHPRGNQWRGFCPYCGKTHTHGAVSVNVDSGKYRGHRVSHCLRKSPQDRGYILVWDGTVEKK